MLLILEIEFANAFLNKSHQFKFLLCADREHGSVIQSFVSSQFIAGC